ncbi:MAG: beta-ketoacyl-[acyl-carrier-protein] synthase II [Actinobacteria bacterium]|nr:beta-ketoacyl-[acyl-carrier-protein] synthase II [Actinomycetota bacterium]
MRGAGHRVAITGYGVVAPCGIGKENFWSGLLGPGFSGARSIEIAEWDPSPYFDSPKDARRSDRCEQFALAAAHEALTQSGSLPYDPARIGTIFGTGIGGLRTLEEQVIVRVEKGERRVSPFLVPMMMSNASGAAISMRYGLQGPAETICTACAASTHAIGAAARQIAWGQCDSVVTGGSESAATITALAGFANMTALSTTLVSKPFDATRDGFIMGEGAAVFVLERYDLALERGATILAEIVGAASNADAHHITAPSPGGAGAVRCMQLALDDAGRHIGCADRTEKNRVEPAKLVEGRVGENLAVAQIAREQFGIGGWVRGGRHCNTVPRLSDACDRKFQLWGHKRQMR